MRTLTASDAAKAVVRRNTEEVQGKGDFDVFEELFWDDFVDHTPEPRSRPGESWGASLYRVRLCHVISRPFIAVVFELAADYGIQFGQGVNARKL